VSSHHSDTEGAIKATVWTALLNLKGRAGTVERIMDDTGYDRTEVLTAFNQLHREHPKKFRRDGPHKMAAVT
jgi:hypothetical protein